MRIVKLVLPAILLFSGCATAPKDAPTRAGGVAGVSVVEANTIFTADLLSEFQGVAAGNIFVSPFSLLTVWAC